MGSRSFAHISDLDEARQDGFRPESWPEAATRGVIPVIVGPTASGKTDLLVSLAAPSIHGLSRHSPHPWGSSERLAIGQGRAAAQLEIISADAFTVYRGMDIGTAKPSAEIREQLPHHLVDILDPVESYSAGRFAADAETALADILSRHRLPVICGGSGLYISALVEGLHDLPTATPSSRDKVSDREELLESIRERDPAAADELRDAPSHRLVRTLEVLAGSGRTLAELRSGQRHKSRFSFALHTISLDRSELYRRINARVERMFAGGLVEEVEALRARGVRPDMVSQKAIGYREVHEFLEGVIDRPEMVRLVQRNTRRYAKRQETWIRNKFPHAIRVGHELSLYK
ncbi:MAG: tRNA (adenosine(37)-N6)-dimethylallyltransferase MiaA [Candidatus Hydrogenedentota bacterium]